MTGIELQQAALEAATASVRAAEAAAWAAWFQVLVGAIGAVAVLLTIRQGRASLKTALAGLKVAQETLAADRPWILSSGSLRADAILGVSPDTGLVITEGCTLSLQFKNHGRRPAAGVKVCFALESGDDAGHPPVFELPFEEGMDGNLGPGEILYTSPVTLTTAEFQAIAAGAPVFVYSRIEYREVDGQGPYITEVCGRLVAENLGQQGREQRYTFSKMPVGPQNRVT